MNVGTSGAATVDDVESFAASVAGLTTSASNGRVEDVAAAATSNGGQIGARGAVHRWACHLHRGRNDKCEVGRVNDAIYHIVPVSATTVYAHKQYNEQNDDREFWERLDSSEVCTPIGYASLATEERAFRGIVEIFETMDRNRLVYSEMNTPADFVKSHLVTDGYSTVSLCNKYLIRQQPLPRRNRSSDGGAGRAHYTREKFLLNVVRELCPQAKRITRKNIPTNLPQWVADLVVPSTRAQARD